MSSDRSSAGDPDRTLALLWRVSGESRRGPRPGLSLDRVVDTAIELADADGLSALTMRRLAQAIGVAPMTLYTYVPGKAELLDLMLDAVYARMPRTDTAGRHWRERVTTVAEENRALLAAHPWVASISTGRPPLGPGQMAKYDHELRALDGLGLSDVELDAALAHLLAFVPDACAGRGGRDRRGAREPHGRRAVVGAQRAAARPRARRDRLSDRGPGGHRRRPGPRQRLER